MKKGFRLTSLTLIAILLVSLAVPVLGFADSPFKDNGNQDKMRGYEKELKDFSEFKGHMIKFNKNVIKFDTTPLEKGGRVLIPIRAIENMGGEVEWNKDTHVVTISFNDKELVFDMEDGSVTDGNNKEVAIEVKPGIHNNRTYVPLRFIAEYFDLKVNYDNKTGDIDINENPKIQPKNVSFEEKDDIDEAVEVKLILNDHTFEGIKGLDEGSTLGADEYFYDEPNDKVFIDEDYLDDLDYGTTVLTFEFSDNKDLPFTIYLGPSIVSPTEKTFAKVVDVKDVEVELRLNGYELIDIKNGSDELNEGNNEDDDDYDLSGNTVILYESYLEDLTKEKNTLTFVFENEDNNEVELDFVVTIEEL